MPIEPQLLAFAALLLVGAATACGEVTNDATTTATGAASGSGGLAGMGGKGGSGGSMTSNCDLQLAQQTVESLGLTAAGPPNPVEMTLPTELTGPIWDLLPIVCEQGGYDVSPFAGSTVCLVGQDITRVCQELPARVEVLMRDGAVGCVYVTLRPGSGMAPGIYSVTDPYCHD